MPEPASRDPIWWRLQRALGLGPLAVYAVAHLWTHWPALSGREAWLARAQRYAPGAWLGGLVLALLMMHAVLGLARARQREPGEPVQLFPLVTGVVVAGFTVYHLTQVWPPPDGVTAMIDRSYERLWEQLGQPAVLALYVLGCGALAAHLAHGVYHALAPRVPQALQAPLRYASGLCGLVLFVLYLQLIGRFAAGEPMLPSARPTAADSAYAQLDP